MDVDLQNIRKKLEMDLASLQILEICHRRRSGDEPPVVKFFDLSMKNKRMIQSLHVVQHSPLFRDIWQKCIKKAVDFCKDDPAFNGALTIDKVQELVWMPSNRRWRGMWERIISGEISLKDVDEKFHRFRDDHKSLDIEIKTVLVHFSDEDDIKTVLHSRVNQIEQCQKLRECEDAAAAILDFKEAMELKGDFQVLSDFLDQVNLLE